MPEKQETQFSVLSALGSRESGGLGERLMSIFVVIRGVVSIASMFLEMFLRPLYGSRYFFITTPVLTWILMGVWSLATLLLGLVSGRARIALFDIGSLCWLFDIACLVHAFRVWWLMTHLDKELDSEYEGPPLPIFYVLPNAKSWTWTRIVYEPATALVSTTMLYTFHIISTSAMLFLLFATFCLFFKTVILWYEGFVFIRVLRDTKARAGIMQDIAAGRDVPQTIGSTVLAGIPRDTSPETRSAIAQSLTGLTPELDALVTPVEPAVNGREH